MTSKERQQLINSMEINLLQSEYCDKNGEFNLDNWLSRETVKPKQKRTSKPTRIKQNAEKLLKIGGYPSKVITRMRTSYDKEDYQGVIDIAAKFDSFIRWAEMVGMTEHYTDQFEYDPDTPPTYNGRPIDMN